LVPEDWSLQELLNAGWSEDDLAWEFAAESTAEAISQNDVVRAKQEAGRALQIARASFEPIDPRLGTSLTNFGLCLNLSEDDKDSASLFAKGLASWKSAGPWIARLDAPRVARSSLFHLRMEARHRDTYRARWQQRWNELAADATARLDALTSSGSAGRPVTNALAAWRRERPAMLNDTRKLMAAVLLLLAPPAADS
jgi:hypothetical protein